MNCDQYPLFRFARGEITSARASRMAAHVAHCTTCQQRLQVILALQRYHRTRERSRRRPQWLLVAAGLALTVAAVVVEKVFQDGPPDSPVVAVQLPYPLVLLNNRSEVDPDRRPAYQAYLVPIRSPVSGWKQRGKVTFSSSEFVRVFC